MIENLRSAVTAKVDIGKYDFEWLSGGLRKFEAFSFNWDAQEYFFCKGERGPMGFTTVLFNDRNHNAASRFTA